MTETPQEMAARADRVLAKCRDCSVVGLADVENLRNAVRALADECQRLAGSESAVFPGVPGSRWRDSEGDLWIHGDDGRMWLVSETAEPDSVMELADRYGPMVREDGS